MDEHCWPCRMFGYAASGKCLVLRYAQLAALILLGSACCPLRCHFTELLDWDVLWQPPANAQTGKFAQVIAVRAADRALVEFN